MAEKSEEGSAEKRRKILRMMGLTASAGVTGSNFSGLATAGGSADRISDSDSPDVGTEMNLPAGGGGLSDTEWDTTNSEQDYQVTYDILDDYINPGDLPIDACYQYDNGNEVCVSTASQILKGTRECSSGTTPVLHSIKVTIQDYQAGSLSTDLNIWVGVDDGGCLWVGQENTGACVQLPTPACDAGYKKDNLVDEPSPWVNALQEVANWLENNQEELVYTGALLGGFALAVFLLPLSSIVSGLLVAAGLASSTS
ncbi:hypothetical protein [Halorussus ruber]|uniref:hypothetical protein n=1 Tax=Halorussus ruber TaxID=1126238 RepID=UPI00109208BB|nr:hypothetical protein [Halorussus ruber]